MEPASVSLHRRGLLQGRIQQAHQLLASCVLCARRCGVDRTHGERGICKAGTSAFVSSFGPHLGEEAPLVGRHGSGTIFLSSCNLLCVFCQNHEISHERQGQERSAEELAAILLRVQGMRCHNLNFVTPTHQLPVILEALWHGIQRGLHLPVVWNCSGYESPEALAVLDGIVDIYMPDFKFWDSEPARRYLLAPDYPEVARAAVKEMQRQVGDLEMDERGIALRGLLVRHLVMPDQLAGTKQLVTWLATEVSPRTYINVMSQYRPCYRAHEHPEINRRPTRAECEEARRWAREAGLRLDR